MTSKNIKRRLNAVFHLELSACRSLLAASRFANPVGRAAIRSSAAARRKMEKAKQMVLALESRCESEQREKARKMKAKSKEFRQTWDDGKRKRKKKA